MKKRIKTSRPKQTHTHKNPSLFLTCSLIPFHRAQTFLSPLRVGFLNLDTIDILHQIVLCYQRAALYIVG